MTEKEKINKLVLTSLLICMIAVTTMFFKIPIPFANGYVHLGDAMVFLSVLTLGTRYGALASAVGSAMGDVLGGFAIWAPWTFVIKGLMALIMGLFIKAAAKRPAGKKLFGVPAAHAAGMFFAGLWMVFGYYIAEGVIYGFLVALLGIPWNIGQFIVGMCVASATAAALYKTPAKKLFVFFQ
jgi:uncharacterized membrane protein